MLRRTLYLPQFQMLGKQHSRFISNMKEIETGFDIQWRTMSNEDKIKIAKEYKEIEKMDWHELTQEQKRKIYTISYGPPETKDPYEKWKIFGGTLGVIFGGLCLFATARYFAQPPPRTLDPEYQKATEEYLRKQNVNPIFGVSSKQRNLTIEDVKIE